MRWAVYAPRLASFSRFSESRPAESARRVSAIWFEAVAVAAFVPLAYSGGDLKIFAAIMAVDSFGLSFAGVALVTYMSSLTSLGYTATQYALLSSAYAYLGKILKGFSGEVVDTLSHGNSLMDAYAIFFAGAAAIGLPALILCLFLVRAQPSLRDH